MSSEFDSLMENLLGTNIAIQPNNNLNSFFSAKKESEHYKLPIKKGKENKSIEEGQDKPWIVGTFLPNQYVNATHQKGHFGVDIRANRGEFIFPMGSGIVIDEGFYPQKSGFFVKIGHESRDNKNFPVTSFYAHNEKNLVKKGDFVTQTTPIATVGATGNSRGVNHLHWEVKINGNNIDPLSIINKIVGSLSAKQKQASTFSLIKKWAMLIKFQ